MKREMDNAAFKMEIEKCKTPNQVYKVLDKYGRTIVRSTTEEVGIFSIWISETERIYKPHRTDPRKHMIYQKWRKYNMGYSGIPVFNPSGRWSDSYF